MRPERTAAALEACDARSVAAHPGPPCDRRASVKKVTGHKDAAVLDQHLNVPAPTTTAAPRCAWSGRAWSSSRRIASMRATWSSGPADGPDSSSATWPATGPRRRATPGARDDLPAHVRVPLHVEVPVQRVTTMLLPWTVDW